ALQILLELKGLTYQQIGRSNTYVVSPRSQNAPNQITRIYILSHVPLIPILANEGTTSGGGSGTNLAQLAGQNAMGGGGAQAQAPAGGAAAGGAGGGGGGGGRGAASPIAIINVINSLLSPNGRVAVDPRTNAVIVTDIPEIFPQVEQIIAELDKKVPQVMIEAQIVEINSTRSSELGINWGQGVGKGGLVSFTPGQRQTTFPFNLNSNVSRWQFWDPAVIPLTPGAAIANPISVPSVLNLANLQIILKAVVVRGEGRFLGKPKIMTLNNKKARIEITPGTPERENTGVVLEVTPQVNKEGYVTLLIEPSFTDSVETKFTNGGNPVRDIVTRKASTLLRLKNGQTVVLGGLLESKEQRTVQKVPFLGYIPLIGWLFTSTSVDRNNTDLVIFLTPTVVLD
ncbi:MAG: hypothetical protein NTX64_18450, partial [Elusimicrobia bacterium]|nr:hypothetical protein [Elusimicrobiota bacterium]